MEIKYLEDHFTEYEVVLKRLRFPQKLSRMGGSYGQKLRTDYAVRIGSDLHRVYATCFSNAASHWISKGGVTYHLSEADKP